MKLKLTQPWPSDRLPPPTSSLLSVASQKGLIAAAGPDALVIASTESVRKTYSDTSPAENGLKNFTPQLSLPIPRVSQVAFSSDESFLVITAEEGGGLAVYDVNGFNDGKTEAAFQMPTNGIAVRQLVPNPAKDFAHYFAVVLADGKFLLADFQNRKLVDGPNGNQVCRENVSCASWSKLGKQVIAGLGDGTAAQLDQQGAEKARIPRPPQLHSQLPVTAIYWMETHDFLLIHTPVSGGETDSTYHIAHRLDKGSTAFGFQKFIVDPCPAFNSARGPASHFVTRLTAWPPDLEDTLILASTSAIEVGMLTRSKKPLSKDVDPAKITNTYTTTGFVADSSRANLPMSFQDSMSDTSPIGLALDLSATEKVFRPIPTDSEVDETPTPLPALMLLNQEGLLCSWWVVYNDSIRQRTAYPALVNSGVTSQPQRKESLSTPTFSQQQPTQSQPPGSAFGGAGQQSGSAFGTASTPSAFGGGSKSAFGTPNTPGAFGGASALGQRASPWTSGGQTGGAAFGQAGGGGFGKPAFGSSTPVGAGGGMGMNKPSVWGSQPQASPQTGGATFGAPSTLFGAGATGAGGLGGLGQQKQDENKPSGFSSFSSGNAFGNLGGGGNKNASPLSPFASAGQKQPGMSAEPSFGSTVTLTSTTPGASFGQGSNFAASSFGTPAQPQSSIFGKPALSQAESREETMDEDKPAETAKANPFGGFKLGSTFKADTSAKDDQSKPETTGKSLFGSGFGAALGQAANQPTTPIKQEPGANEPRLQDIPSTTPASPPKKNLGDAPLPPDPTTAAARAAQKKANEEAPLPPDPTTAAAQAAQKKANEASPFPIEIAAPETKKAESVGSAPIAGSPPIDLGDRSQFSAPASSAAGDEADQPLPSEDGELWEDDHVEGDEGAEAADKTQGASDFQSRITPASPKRAEQQQPESTTPATTKPLSHTPAGFPKAPYTFAPPSRSQESPRSPSPTRAVTSPLQRPTLSPSRAGPTQPPITVPPQKPIQRQHLQPQPPPPQPQDLEDEEAVRIQDILASDVEPTTSLASFIAHQDYTGRSAKPGIGGQIERVFRDVNSMIDTLGLNARSLRAFVEGHTDLRHDSPREKSDLENEESWTLEEVEDLAALQRDLQNELEDGKVDDVPEKLKDVKEDEKELTRLRAKTVELRKHIARHADPEQRAAQHAAPLSMETQTQQMELRQGVARVQKLMQEVEESMSLLRADLASLPSTSGKEKAAPTVEAVSNTILKMTAMVEQKSGDVDVLEAQIKRLPKGLRGLNLSDDYEDDLVSALQGNHLLNGRASSASPYATPPSSRGRMAANGDPLGMSGMLGSRSSTSMRRSVMFLPEAGSSLRQSVGGSARKKMADVRPEEVERWHAKVGRRRKVLDALRDGVEKRGRRVVRVE